MISLRNDAGFFLPRASVAGAIAAGYGTPVVETDGGCGCHMNKAHWLCAALNGTVEDEKIKFLVNMRCELKK